MATSLDFLGAVGTVTGSRFLLSRGDARVLVDCGLFQGLRELRLRNWAPFPVSPSTVDHVVVSHAHLDHCGYAPALVRDGFGGEILATAATASLAGIVLRDSAHLLREDAEHAREHGYSKHRRPRPLYTDEDVAAAVSRFRAAEFGAPVELAGGFSVALRRAGHILGSSSVTVHVDDVSVLFSGDLGRPSHPLLREPEPPPASDVVVVESTYGDRRHDRDDEHDRLAAVIRRTVKRGGSVVIPAFAVDRTEVILMALRSLRADGRIPDVPVYVDSPMALAALAVYRGAIRDHDPELRPEVVDAAADLFDPGDLQELRSVEESKKLNDPRWPSIIISASGMVSGGRVLHHLAGLLPRAENTVVLAGYQAVGTRGRDLLDGARAIKIHGRYVPVRAEIVDVPAFSVHADAAELVDWLAQMPAAPPICYIVHGEPASATALRDRITSQLGWTAVVPHLGERVRVS